MSTCLNLPEMPEFTLKEYTSEEYEKDMKELLEEKGLREAVKQYLDAINSEAIRLRYLQCRSIQEYLCDIDYLIELYMKEVNNGKDTGSNRNY